MVRQQNKSSNKHVKKTAPKLENQTTIEEKIEEKEIEQDPITTGETEKKKILLSEIKIFCLEKIRILAAKTKEKFPTEVLKNSGVKIAQKVKSLPYKEKGKQALNGLKQGAGHCGKKIKAIDWRRIGDKINNQWQKIKTCKFKDVPHKSWQKIKSIRLPQNVKICSGKYCGRVKHLVSEFWKIGLGVISLFLVFYYGIGSLITENIDVRTTYTPSSKNVPAFDTANGMSFLVKREIDTKMWTPNLPIVFPAYVLDNMPNFQTGIVTAIKDMTAVMRKFERNTEKQNEDIRQAHRLLSYPADVWLMSKTSKFNLAPSSNSQYRKGAKELRKFSQDGVFVPLKGDLDKILRKMSAKLHKIVQKNEEYQQEEASSWFIDTKADDMFYYAKGYAFAWWQMSRTLGEDFKRVIVDNNLYQDWTYLVSSLKKAAELKPLVVRNGKADSVWVPNHLIMQNFYLLRAAIVIEKMHSALAREKNDD